MFSAMFIAAIAVFLVERRFLTAAAWSLAASVFSYAGLMHAYALTPSAVREEIRPGFAWEAAAGYLALAAVFALLAARARDAGRPG
jgi:hypothetical protein